MTIGTSKWDLLTHVLMDAWHASATLLKWILRDHEIFIKESCSGLPCSMHLPHIPVSQR